MLKKVETWLESIPRWAAALLMILLLAAYWPINQFPLFKPHYLPLIWGEQYIPFTGWTTYIYLSLCFSTVWPPCMPCRPNGLAGHTSPSAP